MWRHSRVTENADCDDASRQRESHIASALVTSSLGVRNTVSDSKSCNSVASLVEHNILCKALPVNTNSASDRYPSKK